MLEKYPYIPTLSVLAFPAIAAVLCFVLGKRGRGVPARRLAIWMAILHLTLTGLAVASVFENLQNRNVPGGRFDPLAVPGDHSDNSTALRGGTNWNLITIGTEGIRGIRVPPSAIQFFIGLDGLNLWLLPLTSLITLCSILLTTKDGKDNPGAFLGWLFLIETASLGVFLSFDAILFFAFFEMTLIPAFFLIGRYGVGGGKRDAARTFFLYTLLGGAFTLVGIVGLVAVNPTAINEKGNEFLITVDSLSGPPPTPGTITFSIPKLMRNAAIWDLYAARSRAKAMHEIEAAKVAIDKATTPGARALAEQQQATATMDQNEAERRHTQTTILFFALLAGFAVKLPIVPFHTWLPAAYSEAPAGITMFLSAILAKLGAFGILRLAIPLCPGASEEYGMKVVGSLAAIGIVYSAFCAYAQTDIKRLVAYSSVSHLGLIVLGAFALNVEGVSGAVFQMLAHGLSAGLMFGLLAFLADRYGTLDSNRFGGLFARYPKFTFFFMVAALAGVGLPGLCNFVGEMLVIAGLFANKHASVGTWPSIAACAGLFLSVWYTFTLVRKVFFGPVIEPKPGEGENPPLDITAKEFSAFALLAICCLALGLAPQPILKTFSGEAGLLDGLNSQANLLTDPRHVQNERLEREAERIPNRVDGPEAAPPRPERDRNGLPAGAGKDNGPAVRPPLRGAKPPQP